MIYSRRWWIPIFELFPLLLLHSISFLFLHTDRLWLTALAIACRWWFFLSSVLFYYSVLKICRCFSSFLAKKEVCSGKSMPSVFRCGSSSNQSQNLGPGNGDEISKKRRRRKRRKKSADYVSIWIGKCNYVWSAAKVKVCACACGGRINLKAALLLEVRRNLCCSMDLDSPLPLFSPLVSRQLLSAGAVACTLRIEMLW